MTPTTPAPETANPTSPVSLDEKQRITRHIGTIIKNSPELHDLEYSVGFNMHANTLFRKMVTKELLGQDKGVRIYGAEFYKGLLFLDYFCTVIEDDFAVRDYLIEVSKKLRKIEKDHGWDKALSFFPFEDIVATVGQCANNKGEGYYTKPSNISSMKACYASQASPVNVDSPARQVDLYYESIGLMAYDLITKLDKKQLMKTSSATDIKAIIFTDVALEHLVDRTFDKKICDCVNDRQYLEASIYAVDALGKENNEKKTDDQIMRHFEERSK